MVELLNAEWLFDLLMFALRSFLCVSMVLNFSFVDEQPIEGKLLFSINYLLKNPTVQNSILAILY